MPAPTPPSLPRPAGHGRRAAGGAAGAPHAHSAGGAPLADELGRAAGVVLQCGLGLTAGAATLDTALAAAAGAPPRTVFEGLALVALPALGVARPQAAARWLRARGRVTLLAALFALAGLADAGVQTHYAQVASAIVWLAAVVSSARWLAATILVSVLGYALGLGLHGHGLAWMLSGEGAGLVVTQVVDLLANGAIGVLAVLGLRRVVVQAPVELARLHAGGGSLTPQLASAARGALPVPGAATRVGALTPAQRAVVRLLVAGRAPKQAARDLGVSLATVRSHIAAAKRTTGARTLSQLVAIAAEAEAAPG